MNEDRYLQFLNNQLFDFLDELPLNEGEKKYARYQLNTGSYSGFSPPYFYFVRLFKRKGYFQETFPEINHFGGIVIKNGIKKFN